MNTNSTINTNSKIDKQYLTKFHKKCEFLIKNDKTVKGIAWIRDTKIDKTIPHVIKKAFRFSKILKKIDIEVKLSEQIPYFDTTAYEFYAHADNGQSLFGYWNTFLFTTQNIISKQEYNNFNFYVSNGVQIVIQYDQYELVIVFDIGDLDEAISWVFKWYSNIRIRKT